MIKIIDNYKIDYIKWDYNRVVMEHYSRHFESKRQGEIYHRLVLGYYDLLNRLTKRYPDIMFEGCASGGGRFDLGTLFYTPQIWCSDENNPIQRTFIQYNTSLGYPLSTIGAHVNANPITPYRTKAMIALFGTYGYEMNPNKLTEDEIFEVNKFAGIYHKYHKEIIEDGTLYHLLSPTHTNFMSMQCVSRDKSKSLVIWINHLKEGDCYRFLKLKGLDENKLYTNTFDGNTYSGKYYMNVGINLSRIWANEFTCQLIILEEY
jgi:alpha-galactosidase